MLICSKLKIVAFDAFDPDNLSPLVPSRQMTVEGEAGSDMFIVLSGTIAVVKQHKVIGELKTHNFFGELAILRPHRVDSFGQLHTRTHYAIEDSVVAALGYEDFQQVIAAELRLLYDMPANPSVAAAAHRPARDQRRGAALHQGGVLVRGEAGPVALH